MRKKIIAGNWKMHKTPAEALQLVNELKVKTVNIEKVDMVVCPPYLAILTVRAVLKETPIRVGAQNLFWENEGAYTGEISAPMLVDAGCTYVIIGHSERRQYFHETDETINRKIKKALEFRLKPIFCIGETLEQREAGQTFTVLKTQLDGGLQDIDASAMQNIIIAYEPVWAIGTGRNATPEQAQEAHQFIRSSLAEKFGRPIADELRIQYGGSVKPENVEALLSQPDVDGALVGGASLKADSFAKIIEAAEHLSKH
ncbi:MAG: triose-phosphate isomerase [candidate division KSB1 bacterium]|nr:triose-phosphate isomerase [candidate division KSB1 bacterium]MDQ7065816.1 triose-phosphate isomerase [candidate division KSB1 bacterium]